MTNQTTNFPFGREDWWELTTEQRMEIYTTERQKLIRQKLIDKHGLFIQGVIGRGAYSIGLSNNPSKPYEFIVGTEILALCLDDLALLYNLEEYQVITTNRFSVINNSSSNLRLGLIKIDEPSMMINFIENFSLGMKSNCKNLAYIYYVVFGDVDNKLPFEKEGFIKEAFLDSELQRLAH